MEPIYLDYNATTPLDPEVFAAMRPYFENHFGNPASASHQWGWAAQSAVQKARGQVAALIGAEEREIFFTAGASEANNLAIFGLLREWRRHEPDQVIHFVASAIEHPSVSEALRFLRDQKKIEVDFVPCDSQGLVSVRELEKHLKPHTRLVSLIWVQNEIGSVQALREISRLTRERKIYLHTDATQGLGKIPFDVHDLGVDLVSGSAHKFYGPKGAGFLYKRARDPKISLQPLIFGGGQEGGLRSGTSNVPAIVGLGAAAEKCRRLLDKENREHRALRDLLWNLLDENIPGLRLNGPPLADRSPVNLNITFPAEHFANVMPLLSRLGMSAGSACHSGTWTFSSILQAIGVGEDQARSTLRLSLGRGLTEAQIRDAAGRLINALKS